jgi:hypothetical protein
MRSFIILILITGQRLLFAQIDTCNLCLYKTYEDYRIGKCNKTFNYCVDDIKTVYLFPPVAQNFAIKESDAKLKVKNGEFWGFNFGGVTYVSKELKSETYGPCWLKLVEIDNEGYCLYIFFRTSGQIILSDEHTVLYFSTGINEPAYSLCANALKMFAKDNPEKCKELEQKYLNNNASMSIAQRLIASELIKNRRANFRPQH